MGTGKALFLLLLSYQHRPRLRVKTLQPCSCDSPVNLLSLSPKRNEQHATPRVALESHQLIFSTCIHRTSKATNLPSKQKSQPSLLLHQVESLPNHHSDIEDPSQPTQYIATKSVPTVFCPSPQGRAYQQRSSKPKRWRGHCSEI